MLRFGVAGQLLGRFPGPWRLARRLLSLWAWPVRTPAQGRALPAHLRRRGRREYPLFCFVLDGRELPITLTV